MANCSKAAGIRAIAGALALLLPADATANSCSFGPDDKALFTQTSDIDAAQRGVAAISLWGEGPRLSDGVFGRVTALELSRLCGILYAEGGSEARRLTIEVAQGLAAIERASPGELARKSAALLRDWPASPQEGLNRVRRELEMKVSVAEPSDDFAQERFESREALRMRIVDLACGDDPNCPLQRVEDAIARSTVFTLDLVPLEVEERVFLALPALKALGGFAWRSVAELEEDVRSELERVVGAQEAARVDAALSKIADAFSAMDKARDVEALPTEPTSDAHVPAAARVTDAMSSVWRSLDRDFEVALRAHSLNGAVSQKQRIADIRTVLLDAAAIEAERQVEEILVVVLGAVRKKYQLAPIDVEPVRRLIGRYAGYD